MSTHSSENRCRYLISHQLATPQESGPVQLVRRESPIRIAGDPSIPEWSVALAPTRTFGPFVDRAGNFVWHDLFTFAKQLHVRRGTNGQDLLLLPFATPRRPLRPAAHITIQIPAGSVWIAAQLFSSLAPVGAYAGVRIKSGTLTISGQDHISGDTLILQPGETITLTLVLDPPALAAPSEGPSAEAANTTADLPDHATVVIAPAGLQSIETGPAALSVYGNNFAFTRAQAAPTYDAELRQVLVALSPSPPELTIRDVRSDLLTPSGSTRVQQAAWSLPVSVAAPTALGDASGAGYLLITAGPGLRAGWQGLQGGPVILARVNILADPSTLLFLAQADGSRASHSFQLWQESATVRSSLDVTFRKRFNLWFFSGTGFDNLQVTGTAVPHLDRPVAVSGKRIDNPIDVTYAMLQRPGRLDLFLASSQIPDNSRGPTALALTNALLTTTLTRRLALNGPLVAPDQIDKGVLNLYFGLYQLVPTLPDPYAANFQPSFTRDAPDGATQVHSQVTWADPATPVLTMELTSSTGQFDSVLPAPVQPGQRNIFFDRFSAWLGDIPQEGLTLLDVSSNADQLGVNFALARRTDPPLAIRDLSLSTAALNVRSFLLPQFQWEPVHNRPNELTTDPTFPVTLPSPTDGAAALVGANSVRLVPIAPIPVANEVIRAYQEDEARASALFTLPFGIDAVALLNRHERNFSPPPELTLLQPPFQNLTGVREFSIRAGLQITIGFGAPFVKVRPVLPGAAFQRDNIAPAPTANLTSVLGTLKTDFNGTFGEEVPITRIDLSGYGANIFSNWVNDSQQPIHISQVAFDAIHGRTSYERIQMTSILWPCQATVVRTITIERYGSGSVIRWDSGWVATTPGLFWHKDAPGVIFHPGVVRGMFNIREIRDTDQIIPLAGNTAPVQAVYFDADVEIEGVQRGQDGNRRVPARRQLGFIQRIPIPAGVAGVGALDAAKLNDLFGLQGPIGGPIDCTIKMGKSQQQMRVTGVFAQPAPPNQFAVAVYGSPVLPAAGHWSVVRVQDVAGTVEPVTSQLGVPLIRQGPATNWPGANPLRWADPADLLPSPNPPNFDYALLFASQSQRILYSRPKVEPTDTNITSAVLPKLADPYAMLRAGGLFPKISDAIPFDKTYPLSSVSGLLKLVPDVVSFPAPPNFTRPLADATKWLSDLKYNDGAANPTRFIIDAAKNWNIDIQRVSQVLKFDPMGEIMTVVHDIHSPTDALDNFPKPGIIFDPVLQAVMEILTLLRSLAPSGGDGLPAPLKVSVSFSGTTFWLSAVVSFKLEGEDGKSIECGVGKIKGELQIGAELSAEILKAKFGGKIFLQITGSYQQEVFPFIYGGGLLRFRITADEAGKTTVDLDACTVGSVGGTVIPGLIDLEATVKYGYYIQFEGGAFQPGIVLGMEGRAKLLSGLLGFSMTVEGRLLMERIKVEPFKVDLRGDILVAGTVTLAWAIHERKSFHASFHQELDWKFLAAAGAGLIPIP